jgi:hypothetical protein
LGTRKPEKNPKITRYFISGLGNIGWPNRSNVKPIAPNKPEIPVETRKALCHLVASGEPLKAMEHAAERIPIAPIMARPPAQINRARPRMTAQRIRIFRLTVWFFMVKKEGDIYFPRRRNVIAITEIVELCVPIKRR